MDELKAHSLFLTLTPTVASLDRSVGLTTEVVEHDQFLVLFQKDETSLSRRIMQEQGSIDLSLRDKKCTYIRVCNI